MTQAFNLAQLANKVNTSGQLNAATGLTGTVAIGNGGTGITAVGAAGNVLTSNGSAWVSQAASAGFSGATVNAASATALTLTNASAQCQIIQFTSPANSIVNLPSATTLLYKGAPIYRLINESQCNAPIQVRNSAGTWIATIPVNEAVDITLEDNSTSAGSWMVDEVDQLPTPISVENASISAIYTGAYTPYNSEWYRLRPIQGCALSDTTYVFGWAYLGTNLYPFIYLVGATLTGNTFSFGTQVVQQPVGNVSNITDLSLRLFRLNSTTAIADYRVSAGYSDACAGVGGAWYNRSAAITVSGNSLTVGAWNSNNAPESGIVGLTSPTFTSGFSTQGFRFRLSDTHFATVYHTSYVSQSVNWTNNCAGNINVTVTSVTGTTQTNGTATTLAANNGNIMGVTSHTDGAFIMTYYTSSSAGAATGIRKAVTCNTSGTTATWGTVTNIDISNVTTYAQQYQYNNGVTLSSTKVCLPTYQITGSGTVYSLSTFTISGATNAYVTSSDCNMTTGQFMCFPRSASSFFVRTQKITGYQNSLETGGVAATMYAVNANNAVYPDNNYTFQNNAQLGGVFATEFMVQPAASTSTVGVLVGAVYNPSPTGTTVYTAKGTLPT